MPDREKVIKGLEHCSEDGCEGCPYEPECLMADGFSELARDALELLKEQENQLTMKYEEGFHDGYKQAMRESVPCYECQEFSCDDCKFKDNRTVKRDAVD